ncbi:YceI family protein [Gramella sp. AN32]|uniref:YceI family protein n=1 Tax=Christiangramia antarctica TaxID=2058158 RepID=A0ABW5X8T0_9FLAO|nr:YceI family protein [Gramella sp. AN32]MCM4155435.1 YceI family protein [Gramella sp. AN32]
MMIFTRSSYIFLFFVVLFSHQICAQFYQTTSVNIQFFSSAPIEDISAVSREGISVLNPDHAEISIKVKIRSFRFRKALMQEHFNENYMESERYPEATFRGRSIEKLKLVPGSSQKIIFQGSLMIHGVAQERQIPAIISLANDKKTIRLTSEFEIKCKDHDIRIPRLLWENIAETIAVNVNANFQMRSK